MEQQPDLSVAEKALPSSWVELLRGDLILGSNIDLWAPGPGQGHSPSVCSRCEAGPGPWERVQGSELMQEP